MSRGGEIVDLAAVRGEVLKRVDAERLADPAADDKATGGGGPDDPRFVADCLANNERGDGVLFAALHRERFVYDKTSGRWLEFAPGAHHWAVDMMGRAVAAVEAVALRYQSHAGGVGAQISEARVEADRGRAAAEELAAAGDSEGATAQRKAAAEAADRAEALGRIRGNLRRRVDRLRGKAGAEKCLWWSHGVENPLAILGAERLDREPLLFACRNGVVDLATGRLRPGSPGDWLVKASPVIFPENVVDYLRTGDGCPCPRWEANQREILGDDEVADFWQRLLGYAMTGLSTEHVITVAIGSGRNGKGTTFELLQRILGDYAWTISPELILEQKNARSSSGAAADLVSLAGRRLIVGAETDEGRRISGSAVKALTGGDTIKARPLYQADELNISSTWKVFLHTNAIPRGLTRDFALQQRLLYVHFPYSYVDDPEAEERIKPAMAGLFRKKDRGLREVLEAEAPGILAWLVRGCLLWQRHGLAPPPRIRADVEALREDEDVVGQFVAGLCEPAEPDAFSTLKDLYDRFERWHKENIGDHVLSRKRLAAELLARGYPKRNVGGAIRVYGLRLSTDYELAVKSGA